MGNGTGGSGGTPGPYGKQAAIAVQSWRTNSNGFHPKTAQQRIDGAVDGLIALFVEADSQFAKAQTDKASPGGVDATSLESGVKSLSLALDGFAKTLAAAAVDDEAKVRTLATLDQAAGRAVAKRQQTTDGELLESLTAVAAVVAADVAGLTATAEDAARETARAAAADNAADPGFAAEAASAGEAAAEAGLKALADSSGSTPR